ncbi:hypothetical protein V1515DRAFT_607652 [Lipomyces mesembrius]
MIVKKPDGRLQYASTGFESVTVVVVEVGVSETYENLFADITRWMQEFHCRTGILFFLSETPRFSYPGRQVMIAYSVANDVIAAQCPLSRVVGNVGSFGLMWESTII